jgi:hypothetical protein
MRSCWRQRWRCRYGERTVPQVWVEFQGGCKGSADQDRKGCDAKAIDDYCHLEGCFMQQSSWQAMWRCQAARPMCMADCELAASSRLRLSSQPQVHCMAHREASCPVERQACHMKSYVALARVLGYSCVAGPLAHVQRKLNVRQCRAYTAPCRQPPSVLTC